MVQHLVDGFDPDRVGDRERLKNRDQVVQQGRGAGLFIVGRERGHQLDNHVDGNGEQSVFPRYTAVSGLLRPNCRLGRRQTALRRETQGGIADLTI